MQHICILATPPNRTELFRHPTMSRIIPAGVNEKERRILKLPLSLHMTSPPMPHRALEMVP
jgi:hypothetical protein